MTDFLAGAERGLLERNGLADFDALWNLQLDAVDEPNTSRGGWSTVFRMDLEGQGFYLKRQSNYLTRTLHSPLGEPSFAREFRNIQRYQQLGIPALEAVFFGERKVAGERRAILMTRALDGWNDLDSLLDPGVPATVSSTDEPLALALKSGNFGCREFFDKALKQPTTCSMWSMPTSSSK